MLKSLAAQVFHFVEAVNSPSTQILRIEKEGIMVNMHKTSSVKKICIDSDRCIYHISSLYLASYVKIKYRKNDKIRQISERF